MALEKSKVLKSAEKFIATGKIVQAIEEYEKILKENPKEWNVMIQVGDLYLKINKTAESIQNFQKVADHYYSDGFFLKAIAIYKRINKLDPNLTDICIRLADLYLKQGLTMDAKSQLQTVAHHYLSKNQNKNAIQTLQRLIEIEPENLKTRNDLARTYQKEGLIPEAIKEYLEISDQLARKNLLKESLAVLETGYKLDPRNTEILRKILTLYSEHHEPAKAAALVEEAVRLDPNNPDVQALMATLLAERNQLEQAHESIDRAIANSGKKEPYWTVKGDIYLKSGNLEEAFHQYAKVVERFVQRKEDIDQAVVLMQKITKANVSFHQAWQKLVDLFSMLRQQTNMIEAQTSLVDALISKNMYEEAAKNLEKLIKVEPEDSQHREKLRFVKSFIERTAPSFRPAEAQKPESQPLSKPSPVPSGTALPTPPSQGAQRKPAAVQTGTVPQQPMSLSGVATPAAPSSEEKDFVSEHLIEAEVFNKYGLIEKAVEQLQVIISKYPTSVVTRQKLKEIYLEKGEREKAVEECVYMSRLFRKQGDFDQAEDLLSEARQINPNHPALDKAYKEIPPPPKTADVLGEIEKLAQSIKTKSGSFRVQRPTAKSPAAETKPAAIPSEEILEPEIEISMDETEAESPVSAIVLPEETFEEIDFYSGQGLVAEARDLLYSLKEKHPEDPGVLTRLAKLEPEKAAEPQISRIEPPLEIAPPEEEVAIQMPEEFEDVLGEAGTEAEDEILIDLDEEFEEEQVQQGEIPTIGGEEILIEPGEEEEEEISLEMPAGPTLDLSGLQEPQGEKEEQFEEKMEVAVSDEELNQAELTAAEDLGPTVFQELEDESVHSVHRSIEEAGVDRSGGPMEPVEESTPVIRTSEDLFEQEEDFFDLAAELEEGLLSVQSAVEEEKPADGQNYSLEQILSDFKKGVEKQLGAEDYDTRYNLGIAYKEMGLIDEAIAEFQIAAKDPKRFLECCSMLGLCFVEKGMPKLAVKWYQRGLETEGYSEEEYQGLRYDMAQAHEVSGEVVQALETYQEVYGINANYRNVARKVKELQEQLRK